MAKGKQLCMNLTERNVRDGNVFKYGTSYSLL